MKRQLLVFLAAFAAIHGQSTNQTPPLAVGRAELLNALKSPTLKAGDQFYLRTTAPWQQNGCTIPEHTTITGHVETLSSSLTRPHNIILAVRFFEVHCSESSFTLMTPLLVAIKAPDPNRYYNAGGSDNAMLRGIFPSQMEPGSGGVGRANDPTSTNALDAAELARINADPVTEKPMKTGEVRGYRNIALTPPDREGPAAKLTSDHRFVLDRAAEFIFAYVPAHLSNPDSSAANPLPSPISRPSTNPAPAKPAAAPPPPEEPEDVCPSSGCMQLSAAADSTSARALWAVPLAELGYQHRPGQRILGLDSSASVHFVGDDQILLAFTRHILLPRSSDAGAWATTPRSVRAVLLSRADGHVLRVQDWTVSDDIGPFVWSLGSGNVIAHVGHDLVRFGPGLTIEQRFHLAGPLLLLSASPKGNLLLAVTVHEKHTEKEHAQLAKSLGPTVPIDEEYDLTGLTDTFAVTGTRRVAAKPLPPALLRNSMVSARPMPGAEWLLEESTWQGQSRRIAHFRSTCPLQIQSFPGDLLFIQGCTPVEAKTWYRVLDARGATLFKGSGPVTDFIQQAQSSDDGRLFAIALSHFTNRYVDLTTQLQIRDFTNLTVTVYDTATGKQFFAAHPPHGSAQADTFSLAPSGSSLAVLTSASLQLFPLQPPAQKRVTATSR